MWLALDFQLYEQQKKDIDFRLQLRPSAQRRLRPSAPWFYPASEVDEELPDPSFHSPHGCADGMFHRLPVRVLVP